MSEEMKDDEKDYKKADKNHLELISNIKNQIKEIDLSSKQSINFCRDYRLNDLIQKLQELSDKNNNPNISKEYIDIVCWDQEKQQVCGVYSKNKA